MLAFHCAMRQLRCPNVAGPDGAIPNSLRRLFGRIFSRTFCNRPNFLSAPSWFTVPSDAATPSHSGSGASERGFGDAGRNRGAIWDTGAIHFAVSAAGGGKGGKLAVEAFHVLVSGKGRTAAGAARGGFVGRGKAEPEGGGERMGEGRVGLVGPVGRVGITIKIMIKSGRVRRRVLPGWRPGRPHRWRYAQERNIRRGDG